MTFVPFDEKTIEKEFEKLPEDDRVKLDSAIFAYEEGVDSGWAIKSYSDGLKMITDGGRGQGRCIFFVEYEEFAVILTVYKKESQKVPFSVLKTAKARRKKYEQGD